MGLAAALAPHRALGPVRVAVAQTPVLGAVRVAVAGWGPGGRGKQLWGGHSFRYNIAQKAQKGWTTEITHQLPQKTQISLDWVDL